MTQLAIRVTPRSGRPGIGGWRKDADGRDLLEIRVAEAPADGAANEAVIRMLAKALRLPRSDLVLVSGQAARVKRIAVPFEEAELRRRLG